ncbi:MAG: SEC-C domain-containing protein, partial [Oscillospiraceae bacterium]|nr:SEC-C domain-containing protein [Oscillospiraceae bacterium]
KDAQINDVSKIRIPISSSSEFSKDLTPSNFIKRRKKQGRNEQCQCGSGKKYKKCCGLTNDKS